MRVHVINQDGLRLVFQSLDVDLFIRGFRCALSEGALGPLLLFVECIIGYVRVLEDLWPREAMQLPLQLRPSIIFLSALTRQII